ncbi:placenta growth factor isoform X4 [Athene noctua]|uniref:placenta growth factor isoform X4 n=1 Tax=Athene noctua TaxID=126797 RepID=UPI003EB8F10A
MRLLGAFLRLLVAGALGAPPAPAPEARGTASAEPAVLTFRDIWNRSLCRPLEQLVDVITEFPNEVEYIFRPSCVSLRRCGGCCGDEGLRCVPVETNTVTMQAPAGPDEAGKEEVQGARAILSTLEEVLMANFLHYFSTPGQHLGHQKKQFS